jgi:hypothetical protein
MEVRGIQNRIRIIIKAILIMLVAKKKSMAATVSLLRAQSYALDELQAQIEAVLAPLGGMAAIVKPGDRVLLKPNLLTGARPTKECVTRPEVVYCVAKLVQAAGGHPFLADSPAFGTAHGVAKANGYLPWLERAGVPIKEMQGQRYPTEASGELAHLLLSKEAMDADVVINLPKVKSHVQLTLTLGVKNLFGCVPGKMKAWWHMEAGRTAIALAPCWWKRRGRSPPNSRWWTASSAMKATAPVAVNPAPWGFWEPPPMCLRWIGRWSPFWGLTRRRCPLWPNRCGWGCALS